MDPLLSRPNAHADLRDSYMGTPHNHACAMRRVLEHARCTQVGIRSLSPEEAAAAPTLPTKIFYDYNMRRSADWIDRVAESRPDLVLMDIMMPEMDGLTAMRELRRQPELHDLPIIALTAKAMRDDYDQCLAAGASDYMAKPLDVDKLVSLCRVWMSR